MTERSTLRDYLINGALIFGCLVYACSAPSRQVQAGVADAVARAANEAAPVIVGGYQRALFACLDKSSTRADYSVCRAKVEHDWNRVRLAWGHLRTAQADYALALERGDADVVTYVQWLRIAYCELRADVPAEALAKVPELPGLACGEFDGREPRPDAGALWGLDRRTLDGGAQ